MATRSRQARVSSASPTGGTSPRSQSARATSLEEIRRRGVTSSRYYGAGCDPAPTGALPRRSRLLRIRERAEPATLGGVPRFGGIRVSGRMDLSRSVDSALDRSIALGYGNVGLLVRRRLPGWPADPPRMDGKVVLITGAASGLGLASATGFARLGASVRALARNEDRARDAVDRIRGRSPAPTCGRSSADLASLDALRAFLRPASTAEEERLDVLVSNAGVMPDERERSADGDRAHVRDPRPGAVGADRRGSPGSCARAPRRG